MARFTPPRDPGGPLDNPRPAIAVLGWLLGSQWRRLVGSTLVSFTFLGCQQVIPFFVGRAIDDGLIPGDRPALYGWALALAVCIGIATATGVGSFIYMVNTGMDTDFRVQRRLVDTVVATGSRLQGRADAGELVSISAADARAFSMLSMMTGRLVSSVLAFVLALAILASQSWWFALAAGIGVPAMFACLRPLFLRLESRGGRLRGRIGVQTGISTDAVAGLRVLRGIGGEAHFLDRYRDASQETRRAGVRVGGTVAVLEFARLALPGALLVVILWMGARFTLAGTITAGEFVALFGYLIALTRPVQYSIQCLDALTKAIVASGRFHKFQTETAAGPDEVTDEPPWPAGRALSDPATGLTVEPGRLTGIATAEGLGAAELLDRLAGFGEPDEPARVGEVPLGAFTTATVRSRIHLMEARAQLFSGPLREQLDVDGDRTDADIMRAIHAASAVDIVGVDPALLESDTVPTEGFDLDAIVGERGRNFSGGERQRLILARALLTDAEILLLDDPASACDAQTEARIAARLARYRQGRTTVIATNSPQLLAVCDRVAFLSGDLATGTHADLLDRDDYREAVTR
ncbi:ABC transporter transmembrane domain-containing protein [Glycomyces buryatensis]|uniref:ABC transporter ATP-binding protein n=1 Tax=Glycomyces buryatensis TaxID=2570927 RepID=A0A4V4HSL9_9ACTN|nr:ABC transporter ATP-binding protein [Glycomyces buryatensis]THV42186.1 ABC transporter ATP-binding protein [Glycomyces buryatensis]